ncbi:MAG: ATP-binding cassette domain-containing protein [Lachnospiraceae bacterium]|nr:ATP-binding cassette domain-containing protein [Lachnospiraceae bacterium]
MLELKNIVKNYPVAGEEVHALRDVSIKFRENEFVSILGHSGCGKTTLLNIIGGLDHYTSGDLIINGKSTKTFKDKDWDSYRNHSIGFVFQSYNLIPHQSVLSNVELALTLSGVSKSERRSRAIAALEKVGLGDQLKKRPSQMSGGQMQRVAIARALVNDPDILLADEPTGALDTATSVQIMDILAEVAKDKLVIMVTHNPELANTYSSRIIRLSDGKITDDSNPYDALEDEKSTAKTGKTSMSYLTALSLSFNNLMTKKGRTILTAFAGSIGIIGIALILSLSNGIQEYIDTVQENTLASYPIQIQAQTMDTTSLMQSLMGLEDEEKVREEGKIYSNDLMGKMVNTMLSEIETNNLAAFKEALETEGNEIAALASTIKYSYDVTPNIYVADTSKDINQVNPNTVMDQMMSYAGYGSGSSSMASMYGSNYSYNAWRELIENDDMLNTQYKLVTGNWPKDMSEVVLIVDENNEVSDIVLYSLGLKDKSQLADVMASLMKGEEIYTESLSFSYEEILNLRFKLVLPTDYYVYDEELGYYVNKSDDEDYVKQIIGDGVELKIVGIVKPNEDAQIASSSGGGGIGYTAALTRYIVNQVNASEIVKAQKSDETLDVLNGLKFDDGSYDNLSDDEKAKLITGYFDTLDNLSKAQLYTKIASSPSDEDLQALIAKYQEMYSTDEAKKELMKQLIAQAMAEQGMSMEITDEVLAQYTAMMTPEQMEEAYNQVILGLASQEYEQMAQAASGDLSSAEAAAYFDELIAGYDATQLAKLYDKYMPDMVSSSTYDENLYKLGVLDLNSPSSISIYAQTFEAKDKIADLIEEYNNRMESEGKTENVISYTDYVGLMMSSVSTIINTISYVLIAFVAISLVVSSIMIGIITYISVLERTKEIGILRAIGASKKDISHVFNAEAITIGFVSGSMGIIITLLLNIPINMIILNLTEIDNIAKLPMKGAVVLVIISMLLTFIAGLVPSSIAAKKDPVEALRTE